MKRHVCSMTKIVKYSHYVQMIFIFMPLLNIKTTFMKRLKQFFAFALVAIALVSCSSQEPKSYGPVEFEITIEGPVFEESVAEGVVTIPFKPEDFGIDRKEVHSMKLSEIQISTDHEEGLGAFNNLVFTIMTDNTESKEVASTKISGNPKEMTIKGLEESVIKGFDKTDQFYLEMSGITRKDFDDNIVVKGKITLDVMVNKK